jgi:hypothetical protein
MLSEFPDAGQLIAGCSFAPRQSSVKRTKAALSSRTDQRAAAAIGLSGVAVPKFGFRGAGFSVTADS